MVDFDRRLLRWAEYAFPDASLNGPRERERVSGAPTDVVINAGFLYGHVAEGNLKNGKFTSAVNPRGYSIGSVDEDKISLRHPCGKHRANQVGYFYPNRPATLWGGEAGKGVA